MASFAPKLLQPVPEDLTRRRAAIESEMETLRGQPRITPSIAKQRGVRKKQLQKERRKKMETLRKAFAAVERGISDWVLKHTVYELGFGRV